MTGAHTCAKFANNGKSHILGGDAWSQRTFDANIHRLGTLLQEALCGQDMLNFAGANTKGQCAHGTMRRGMRVAAYERHARQRDTLLRANNMHNALASVVHVEESHTEIPGILLHSGDTHLTGLVYNIEHLAPADGRHIVIKHGNGGIGSAHRPVGSSE